MVKYSPMQVHSEQVQHNGADKKKRAGPLRKHENQTHPNVAYFPTGNQSPSCHYTQISRSIDGSRTLVERAPTLHATERNEMGNSILQTFQAIQRNITQIYESSFHLHSCPKDDVCN